MFSIFKRNTEQTSAKELKKYYKTVEQINKLEATYSPMSDEELQNMTFKFKERLENGEELIAIIPDAFAVVREASKRVLNMRHFDVQLIGGLVLTEGNIAEMPTGEGKTLVASLPSYVRALEGKGVHVITVNDYLAKRDFELIGQIHRFLGLTVGLNVPMMEPDAKKKHTMQILHMVLEQSLASTTYVIIWHIQLAIKFNVHITLPLLMKLTQY